MVATQSVEKRRTVLHLIDTGGPGGAETVLRNVLRGLDESRWQSVPVAPTEDWLAQKLREDGREPVILGSAGSFDFRYAARLFRLARHTGADLLHAHLMATNVYGSAVARLLGIPVICTFHGVNDYSDEERFQRIKFRIVRRRRNRIVCVSGALRRELIAHSGLPADEVGVVHNGIQTDLFEPGQDDSLRRELGLADGDILIGAVGNLRWWKAYEVLLRAAAVLKSRAVPCRIVVLGQKTRPLYDELQALHDSLDLGDYFVFAGLRDEIPRQMRNFDIYCSSSSDEGFSLTTVEAMATGLPVVATRSGGPEEIIEHDVSGILVPKNDPEALADALQAMVADPGRRAALATGARARAEDKFSVPAMARGYEKLYDEVLAQS